MVANATTPKRVCAGQGRQGPQRAEQHQPRQHAKRTLPDPDVRVERERGPPICRPRDHINARHVHGPEAGGGHLGFPNSQVCFVAPVPNRRVVPTGNRGTGRSLVLQRLQHVESRRSAGGEDGGADPGHHREQDEPGELLAG